jgi:hypothetical protein
MINLARKYLEDTGRTTVDYCGMCLELADDILKTEGRDGDIIYVTCPDHPLWRYHAVAYIDELIHDAWYHGGAIPIERWLVEMFGNDVVTVAMNGDDFYEGRADKFKHLTTRLEAANGNQ